MTDTILNKKSRKLRKQLSDMIESSQHSYLELPTAWNPDDIATMMIKIVEHLFKIPATEFIDKGSEAGGRSREYVLRRVMVVNLIRLFTDMSDTDTGKIVKKDRTSVIHMYHNHEAWMFSDKQYREWFERASSLYSRINRQPRILDAKIGDVVEAVVNINKQVAELNQILGAYLITRKDERTEDQGSRAEESLVSLEG
jgi:hypothetical protein